VKCEYRADVGVFEFNRPFGPVSKELAELRVVRGLVYWQPTKLFSEHAEVVSDCSLNFVSRPILWHGGSVQ